jgi:hypothetical protein
MRILSRQFLDDRTTEKAILMPVVPKDTWPVINRYYSFFLFLNRRGFGVSENSGKKGQENGKKW